MCALEGNLCPPKRVQSGTEQYFTMLSYTTNARPTMSSVYVIPHKPRLLFRTKSGAGESHWTYFIVYTNGMDTSSDNFKNPLQDTRHITLNVPFRQISSSWSLCILFLMSRGVAWIHLLTELTVVTRPLQSGRPRVEWRTMIISGSSLRCFRLNKLGY